MCEFNFLNASRAATLSGASKPALNPASAANRPRLPRSYGRRGTSSASALLLPALSCLLLAGSVARTRADEAAKTDKPAETQPAAKPDAPADKQGDAAAKTDAKTAGDKPADAVKSKTAETVGKTADKPGDASAAPVKSRPALRPTLLARLQDAPKAATPQTNPPQVSDPPQKPAEGQPAAPAAPAPTPPGTITYSGLIDLYYGVNARAPHGVNGPFGTLVTPDGQHIGIDNVGRSFDINDRELTFNLGEFNITRTEGRGFPLGFTATLTVGDTARLVHATEPGGTSAWQNIQQLYFTKTIHALKRDVVFDAGIFVTPLGLEVIESAANDNYSRSFGFQYAIPFYHAGFRITAPITPKLSVIGAGINGWNDIADDNDSKSGLIQLTWKPAANFTGIFGFIGGAEGTGAYGPTLAPKKYGSINTYVSELQGIYQLNPKLKLSGVVDYGTGSGNVPGPTHVSGTWLSLAGYARYQFTPRLALAGRVEQFEDNSGAGGFGLRTGTVGYDRLREGTVTLEYTFLRSHLVTRLEYRHDASNQSVFGAGTGTARDQDTVYGSAAYKF